MFDLTPITFFVPEPEMSFAKRPRDRARHQGCDADLLPIESANLG